MKPSFLLQFGRPFFGYWSLLRPRANRIVLPWQDAIWAQRLQFQNLLAILRANKDQLTFDAQRLRTVDDFQRQVPITDHSKTQTDSGKPWVYPDSLTFDSFESLELPDLLREAQRLTKKTRKPFRARLASPLLVFDRPTNSRQEKSFNFMASTNILRPTMAGIDFLSQLLQNAGESSRELPILEKLLRKKPYRGLVALCSNLTELGIPVLFQENSWLRKAMPALEFAILDEPCPDNLPFQIAWIETISTQGGPWASFQKGKHTVKGFTRAGFFWEFLPPETPHGQHHPKRWWLGNVPLHKPMELAISSCHGFLAQRTRVIVSLVDRRKALFQTHEKGYGSNVQGHQEFRTIPHGGHLSRFDREED